MQSTLKKFMDYVRYCYFHYTVITTVIMMEPLERYIFNAFFTILFSIFLYATAAFLPGHMVMIFQFLFNAVGIVPDTVVGEETQS